MKKFIINSEWRNKVFFIIKFERINYKRDFIERKTA